MMRGLLNNNELTCSYKTKITPKLSDGELN